MPNRSDHWTWEEFATELVDLIPAISEPRRDLRIDSGGPLGTFSRGSLHEWAAHVAGRPPDGILESCDTLGELYDWCEVRSGPSHLTEHKGDDLAALENAGPSFSATRGVSLRPLLPEDIPALYRASLDPATSFRWRYRGTTPSVAAFTESLYDSTLAHFAVIDRKTLVLQGLAALYNADLNAGWAYVAHQRVSERRSARGQMLVGGFLIIDYGFRTWPLRKIYAEIPSYNFDELLKVAAPPMHEEGVLSRHLYHNGQYINVHILAIDREDWEPYAARWWDVYLS